MIIDPEFPPDILNYWCPIFVHYGTVFSHKNVFSIENVIIDVVHDRGRAIVRILSSTDFPFSIGLWYALRIENLDMIAPVLRRSTPPESRRVRNRRGGRGRGRGGRGLAVSGGRWIRAVRRWFWR